MQSEIKVYILPGVFERSGNMPLLKEKVYTIEDIYALPEGERAELIDGQIYYMSPPNTRHQRISSILSRKIGNYIDDNKDKEGLSSKRYSPLFYHISVKSILRSS